MKKEITFLRITFIMCMLFFQFSVAGAANLINFSWSSGSAVPEATTTYTFSYQIVTASPNMIIYAYANSDALTWNGIETATCTINGVSATINTETSWAEDQSFAIRLEDASLATSGANIVITCEAINGSNAGTYPWTFIRTANGGGNEIDGAVDPEPVVLETSCINPTLPILTASSNTICPGTATTLSVSSGTLNDATAWHWYSTDCGVGDMGTGNSISTGNLSAGTYTFYARGEGGCVTPGTCASISITAEDITDPETPTLTDVTGECSATATAPTTTDNCAGTITGTTSDDLTYSTQGTHVITWNFDDSNGNSIDVTQNVVIADVTAPVPDAGSLTTVTDECSATVSSTPTATDNCAGTITGTTTDPLIYTEQGTYTITWTYDDSNGNITTQIQNVIIDDVTNPETPDLSDLTDECSVTATAPTTTDNCAGTVKGTTSDPLTYDEQGTYIITWFFNDGNGNKTKAKQTVIVEDITNPTITCIENHIINLGKGETTYTVSGTEFDPVSTDDNCNVASVINDFNALSTLDGAMFPVGTTKIVWTVKDDAENTNTCIFEVTVNEYTDIENLRQNGISIYPNPTNGIINIETGNNNIQNIKISDITGKTLIKKSDIQQNEAIDLSELESGIYIISIQTDKNIFTTKIIKK